MSNAAERLDPEALARLGRLEIIARLVVEGFISGRHRSPYKGFSAEFAEHRPYTPGDEIRHIDWRAFGKTDRYYIKEYEEETNLKAYLLVDASGSMAYKGETQSKFTYARNVAAALAYLMLHQQDAVGLVVFDTEVRHYIPPRAQPRHFNVLADVLEGVEPGGETSLATIIHDLALQIRRRGLVILISDCFDRLDDLLPALRHLRHRKHEVILLQVVAPEELVFPFKRWTQFRSLESDAYRRLVDPQRLRSQYLARFGEFTKALADGAGQMHVDYHQMATYMPYDVALGEYLSARAGRR